MRQRPGWLALEGLNGVLMEAPATVDEALALFTGRMPSGQ